MKALNKIYPLLLLLIMFSCVDTKNDLPDPVDDYITLRIKVPGIKIPSTYALDALAENKVDIVQLLLFEYNSTDNEEYYKEFVTVNLTSANDVTGTDGSEKEFKVKLPRTSNQIRIVVLANVSTTQMSTSGIAVGDTKDAAMNKFNFSYSYTTLSGPSPHPFPMWGEAMNRTTISNLLTGNITIALLRAIAKVDVGIDLYSDPSLGFGERFKLNTVYVCKVADRGYVAPDMDDVTHGYTGAGNTGDPKINVSEPNVYTSGTFNGEYAFTYDGVTVTANNRKQILRNEIYIPENNAYTSGTTTPNTNRTFLIIEGYLDGDVAKTYYRIDFADGATETDLIDIQRNFRYLVNITGAKGPGYATLAEAKAATKGSNLTYTMTITDEILDITYNGQFSLGVNDATHFIDWNDEAEKAIRVYTDYNNGWEASSTESWISFKQLSTGLFATGGCSDPVSGDVRDMTIKLAPNTTAADRIGTITLKAGSLTKEITIKQSVGSNCIIASRGSSSSGFLTEQTVYLPWSMANAHSANRITGVDASKYNMKVLWNDNAIGNAVNSNTFTPAITTEGYSVVITRSGSTLLEANAVVAITDLTDQILWSWHIWVANDISYRTNNGFNIMDRNLGNHGSALNAYWGLYYQWGRKDPFPGIPEKNFISTVTFPETVAESHTTPVGVFDVQAGTTTVNAAIANPTTFYTNSSFNGSWVTDNHNNYWNTANGEKGLYDPCPFGWRVPTSGTGSLSPWYGVTSDSQGPNLGFYQRQGYIAGATGKYTDIDRGYVTTASAMGFFHYLLTYAPNSIDPSNTSGQRAAAYPVRCVKIEY